MERDGYLRVLTDHDGFLSVLEEGYHTNSFKEEEILEIGYDALLPKFDYPNAVLLVLFSYGANQHLLVDEVIFLFDYNNKLKEKESEKTKKRTGIRSLF